MECGNKQEEEPLDSNPFRYCGEYWDSESGTFYLRARNYDPATGRFQGEDSVRGLTRKLPNKQEVTDPLSLNLYTYGHNNPISNLDRTGNFSIGNIFNGVFMAYLGYAAITVGMAALTVATGGAALIAAATVVAGVGAMSLGASEVIEGVTTYNPMRTAMGDQLYADSVMLTSMGTMAGMQYSGMYYQMYGGLHQTSGVGLINPNKIGFSQSSIKKQFSNGVSLDDTIAQLKSGTLKATDLPAIRIFERDGLLYSLDNRRLYVAQQAGVSVQYIWATEQEVTNEIWKMTTVNYGASIRVR